METYVALSWTNYGEIVYIINAESEEEAKTIATSEGAWPGFELKKVDTVTRGLVGIHGGDG